RPVGLFSDHLVEGSPPVFGPMVMGGEVARETFHVRMTSAGQVLDTIAVRSIVNQSIPITLERGGRIVFETFEPQPFADDDLILLLPSGREVVRVERSVRSARDATIAVTRATLHGDTLFHRRIAYAPLPIEIGRAHV